MMPNNPKETKIVSGIDKPFWKKRGFQIFVILPFLIYGTYKFFYPTYSWNERMIITVETPNGEIVSSVVRGVKIVYEPQVLPQMTGVSRSLKGEAAVVDLGEGKYMFALLNGPFGWASSAYGEHIGNPRYPFSAWTRWTSHLTGQWPLELPAKRYPEFVTFDDLADPASVKEVDPERIHKTFGEGYKLKSINIEITFDWVTTGNIKEVLKRTPGDGSLDKKWSDFTSTQHKILSSLRWVRKR